MKVKDFLKAIKQESLHPEDEVVVIMPGQETSHYKVAYVKWLNLEFEAFEFEKPRAYVVVHCSDVKTPNDRATRK